MIRPDIHRVDETARRVLGKRAALRQRGHSCEIGVQTWDGETLADGSKVAQFVLVVRAYTWEEAEHRLLSLSATALLAIVKGQRPAEVVDLIRTLKGGDAR